MCTSLVQILKMYKYKLLWWLFLFLFLLFSSVRFTCILFAVGVAIS